MKKFISTLFGMALLTSTTMADNLFQDNFTSSSTNLNSNKDGRQSGSLGTQDWTAYSIISSGSPVTGSTAYLSNNSLRVVQGGSVRLGAMPLNSGNIPSDSPLTISFTMQTLDGDSTDWTSFRFASSLNPNDPGSPTADAGDFGFLYRKNTGIQIFSGGLIYQANSSPYGNDFSFIFSDSNGGSPFNGTGTKAQVYQGSRSLGIFTLSQAFVGDHFIAFGNDGNPNAYNQGSIDNLVVSVVPEPSAYALFGIGAIGMFMVMRRTKVLLKSRTF